jgi:hypothetical protein
MSTWFKNNVLIFFFGIFASVGGCMGVMAGVFGYDTYKTRSTGERTVGVVVEMVGGSDGAAPIVEFQSADGQTHRYTSEVYSSPPAFHVGKEVKVWYNPENPENDVVLGHWESWFLPIIFGIFFITFGGIGFGGMLGQLAKIRKRTWLRDHGTPLEVETTGVFLNTSFKVNGRSPWVIQAQWLDKTTNTVYTFESDSIWYDPTDYLETYGKKVRVLIDPANPKAHWMDTSFLPKSA